MQEKRNNSSENFKVDLSKVIKVENFYLKQYDCYIIGYLYKNSGLPAYDRQKITKMYYFCNDCKSKIYFSRFGNFKNKKNKYGNLCQKCATKRNCQEESFKEKEKASTKKRWENGGFDHLKENGYFLKWGRENCKNMLDKNEEEKKIIAEKKIKTWAKHSEEEKREINYRRTKHFLENYYEKGKCNRKFTPAKRFLTKEWQEVRTLIINRDLFTCQKCKKVFKKSKLAVHHLIPYRFCQNNNKENLITLCKSCHSKVERFLEKNCILEEGKVDVEKELEFIKNN